MHIKGFTLIELLVVVLIIGILASIAVPKYTFAIERTKWLESIVIINALAKAQERYLTTYGTYSNKMELLDIQPPANTKYFTYYFHVPPTVSLDRSHIESNRTGQQKWLTKYFNDNFLVCGVANSDTAGKIFCAKLTGSQPASCRESGFTCYKVNQ